MDKNGDNGELLRSRSWLLHSLSRVSKLAWPVLPPRRERPPHLTRNALAILGFDFTWGLAASLVTYATVLTGCLKTLHASPLLIALIPGIFWGTYSLIQPLSTFWVKPVRGRLFVTLLLYGGAALTYMSLGALLIWLPSDAVNLRIVAVFAAMVLFITALGLGDPHYIALMMEVIEPRWRSRFFAAKGACFGVGCALGSGAYTAIMHMLPPVTNYGAALLCGGLILVVAVLIWSVFREPDTPPPNSPRTNLSTYLAHLFRRFRDTPSFGRLVVCAGLLMAATGIVGFSNTYIRDILGAGSEIDGALTIALAAAILSGSFIFGILASAIGFRLAYATSAAAVAVGLGLMVGTHMAVWRGVVAPDRAGLWLSLAAYFIVWLWTPAQIVCLFNLCVDLAHRSPAAEAVASLSLSMLLFRLLGPTAAGWAIDRYPKSSATVFAAAAGVALVAAALLVFWLKDGDKGSSRAPSGPPRASSV